MPAPTAPPTNEGRVPPTFAPTAAPSLLPTISPAPTISQGALERLVSYDWPGNVRELENVVERMLIFATGHRLEASDIPQEILNWREEEEEEPEDYWFQAARTHFERQYLREALRRHNGVISKAARAIGMSRKNLYMRLGDLHIDYNAYRQ